MKTIHIFLVFIAVVIIQLLVPAKMIYDKEDVLTSVTVYKFKTQPIDPNDPFRGKYVVLNYQLNTAKIQDSTIKRTDKILLYLKKDSLGYAAIYKASKVNLDIDRDYILVDVDWYNKHEVGFSLPFDRYYMEESKAKPAEDIYRKFNRRNDPLVQTYATVSVKNGDAVLKDIFIDDKSIHYYIEKEANQ